MAAYVFLIPPHAAAGDGESVAVKDGFAWIAFIVPVLWFAFHRMWLWAAGFLLLGLALALLAGLTGWEFAATGLGLLANLWAGLEAGSLRAAHLERHGWTEADIVVAPGRGAAEDIHFANLAAGGDALKAPGAAPPPSRALPRGRDDGPALGLFDHEGDR